MRFVLALLFGLSLGASLGVPTARATGCECDSRPHPEQAPGPAPPSYTVRRLDAAPAEGFHSIAPLGNGHLAGLGPFIWRYDGRWHRQRAVRAEPGDRLVAGGGRLVVMHRPSPVGSTDTSRQGAIEVLARRGTAFAYPPSACTLSTVQVVRSEVLAAGQCFVEASRTSRERVEGVALRLEGERFVELGPRPLRPVRALASTPSRRIVILDDRGVLLRLESGRWRRGLAGLRANGWQSLGRSDDALWLGSDRGEVARLDSGDRIERLPPLPGGGAILELAGAGASVLLRTHDRLWLWDGRGWQDRGATPNDCSAVDYCVGRVTQLSSGEGELWALRDGIPERHSPGPGHVPFFFGRAIDEMAVGTRGELYWTRHDGRRSQLLRTDDAGTRVLPGFNPVMLWAGADQRPWLVDADGAVFRYNTATGGFERRADPPCERARALLGHGDHAYFSCGERGVLTLWMGDHYARVVCPERACAAAISSVRVAGSGFPFVNAAPGPSTLLVSLADGAHAIRRYGRWSRPDRIDLQLLESDVEQTSLRRVDIDGRVWASREGRITFDGPDTFSGGRGFRTSTPLPALRRFAITHDASVIWAADDAGRLVHLTRE